jgi:hypothetical protein
MLSEGRSRSEASLILDAKEMLTAVQHDIREQSTELGITKEIACDH